jgi:hypothetical protein
MVYIKLQKEDKLNRGPAVAEVGAFINFCLVRTIRYCMLLEGGVSRKVSGSMNSQYLGSAAGFLLLLTFLPSRFGLRAGSTSVSK